MTNTNEVSLFDAGQEYLELPKIEKIRLTARVIDEQHFVFIPEYWERALKPYKKAHWKSDWGYSQGNKIPARQDYTLKSGIYLVFPEFKVDGGFYVARLYSVVKEMSQGGQAHGTFEKDSLTIEDHVEGKIVQRVTLKTNPVGAVDGFYHAVMWHMW